MDLAKLSKMSKAELLEETKRVTKELEDFEEIRVGLIKNDFELRKQADLKDKEHKTKLEELDAKYAAEITTLKGRVSALTSSNESLNSLLDTDFKAKADELEKLLKDTETKYEKEISDLNEKLQTEIKRLMKENVDLKTENKGLSDGFNDLAKLFDEYIRAFDDQHTLYKVMIRNTDYTLALLKGKIEKFNSKGE